MSAQRVDPTAASLNYRGMSVSSVQQLLEDTDVPLLRGLSKRDLRRIARLAEVKRCMPGATIFRAGARGDAFYIIVAGNAEARMPDGGTEALHAATTSASWSDRARPAPAGEKPEPAPRARAAPGREREPGRFSLHLPRTRDRAAFRADGGLFPRVFAPSDLSRCGSPSRPGFALRIT